jgi:RNA polymerase sigma-70 factor (ECF subfamily)
MVGNGVMTDSEQERAWVMMARQGDKQAFGRLVQAYQRPIYNLTYRMLNNPEEAEDAAQETFLRAFASLKQYNPDHKFSTWLFSIANHHCIDRLRKRRMVWVSMEDNPVLENLEGEAPRPEDEALTLERSAEIQRLVSALEPDYRMPLILRYWEDYSYEEIAAAMDLTVPAVKSRLFRARQQMAKLLQERAAATTPPSGTEGERAPAAQAFGVEVGERQSYMTDAHGGEAQGWRLWREAAARMGNTTGASRADWCWT